jgi:hypothetical protein
LPAPNRLRASGWTRSRAWRRPSRSEDGHSNKRRQAELEREPDVKDAERARKEAERSEQLAGAAERRTEQADERAQAAVERFDRLTREAHAERAALEA